MMIRYLSTIHETSARIQIIRKTLGIFSSHTPTFRFLKFTRTASFFLSRRLRKLGNSFTYDILVTSGLMEEIIAGIDEIKAIDLGAYINYLDKKINAYMAVESFIATKTKFLNRDFMSQCFETIHKAVEVNYDLLRILLKLSKRDFLPAPGFPGETIITNKRLMIETWMAKEH